jgi:osmotically-inducible protein OsmY
MKRFLRFALVLAVVSTSGLIAADKTPAAADNRIYDQVRMRLANDPDVKGGALDVEVKDGVVTIQGRVDTDKGKKKAEKLAKKVKGVKSVDNEITVGPPQ